MIRELLKNKDLILYSVKGDLKSQMSNKLLGYLWWILDPVLYMAVYSVLVVVIFNVSKEKYPVFIFAALVPWKWTTTSLFDCVNSISGRAGLINQARVDTIVFPVIKSISNFLKFCFGLLALIAILLLYQTPVTFNLIYIIPVVIIQFLFNLGIGLVLANLGVFYRDINNVLTFGLRMWFYLSPGLWAIERFPVKYEPLLWLNPMTAFFTSYRNILLYDQPPTFSYLLGWLGFSLLAACYGWRSIKRNEGIYAKVV